MDPFLIFWHFATFFDFFWKIVFQTFGAFSDTEIFQKFLETPMGKIQRLDAF